MSEANVTALLGAVVDVLEHFYASDDDQPGGHGPDIDSPCCRCWALGRLHEAKQGLELLQHAHRVEARRADG